MTGPEDFVRGLDDPAGPPARRPDIDGVVHRGRQLRARRYALASASAVVLSSAVAVAAFGVVPGISAARTGTNHRIAPADTPSATASASPGVHRHGGKQVLKVAPPTLDVAPTHAPSPVPKSVPVVDPCAVTSPAAVDPSATSQPSPAATAGDTTATSTCTSPSPTASETPSGTASPSPTDTPVGTASPAAQLVASPQA